MVEFTYPDIEYRVKAICGFILEREENNFHNVYGIPMGGIPVAIMFAKELNLPVLQDPDEISERTLVVDDLVDTGDTLEEYIDKYGCRTATIFSKSSAQTIPNYCFEELDGWVKFPWENTSGIEDNIQRIFQYIGEDPKRPGLLDTPKRMAKMWLTDLFRGYDPEQKPNITTFNNGEDGVVYDTMVCDSGDFYSNCEHHMLPFFGKYAFAYVPNPDGKILGLSKVARVVDYCASRMQIQERLGKDVIDMLEEAIGPNAGIAIALEAEHLCKSMRGVKKKGTMRTVLVRGLFKSDGTTRQEFLNYIENIFPRNK